MTPAEIRAAIQHEYAMTARVEMVRHTLRRKAESEITNSARKRFLNRRAERAFKFAIQGRES